MREGDMGKVWQDPDAPPWMQASLRFQAVVRQLWFLL